MPVAATGFVTLSGLRELSANARSMLLLNALMLLLSKKELTGSAMHAGSLLEIKARPSLFIAFAAAFATRAAFAAPGVIRCTILDSPAGR
jgi:hypothetical protein